MMIILIIIGWSAARVDVKADGNAVMQLEAYHDCSKSI